MPLSFISVSYTHLNRYFAGMLSAIGREAAQHGYNINITLHDNNRKFEQDQLTRLSSYRMDGIILSSVNEGAEYAKFLESLETPIVTVDNKIADGLPFVSIDQRAAMREAVELSLIHISLWSIWDGSCTPASMSRAMRRRMRTDSGRMSRRQCTKWV